MIPLASRSGALLALTALVPGTGVLVGTLAIPALPGAWQARPSGATADPRALADLVTGACAGVSLLAWAWLSACVALCLVAHVRHSPAPRGVPALVRVLVAVALGAAGVGTALPAAGAATPSDGSVVRVLTGLRVPDRTLGGPSRATVRATVRATARATARARTDRSWIVRPGDTLWEVAAHQLAGVPRGAPVDTPADALVEAQWHRIYRANRAVLGPDPDLIHPGTVLHLPRAPRTTAPSPHRGGSR